MKKICVIICAFLMIILLGGCGKVQTLSCNQTASGVDVIFNVGFKGNVIQTMDFHYNLDVSSYDDEKIELIKKEDFCSTVKDSMESYKDAFSDCKYSIVDKALKVDAVMDVNKIAKNAKDRMTSVDNAKKELENQGYKCTIK